jgi:hypothetical protein
MDILASNEETQGEGTRPLVQYSGYFARCERDVT